MDRLNNEQICKRFNDLKEQSSMSYQDIADKTNIPCTTVKRIFAGKTDTLGFHTLYDLVIALGGTMEKFLDVEVPKVAPVAAEEHPTVDEKHTNVNTNANHFISQAELDHSHSQTLHVYQELLLSYKINLEKKQQWITRLFLICIILVVAIISVLIYDIASPDIGYIVR